MVACAPYYPVELQVDTNTPPVIVRSAVTPGLNQDPIAIQLGDGCLSDENTNTFTVPVVDYDGAESLSFKWILTATVDSGASQIVRPDVLDADNTFPTVNDPALVEALLGEGATTAAPDARVATIRLDLTIEVIAAQFIPEDLTGNDKTHLLELFVSDRPFGQLLDVEPQPNPGEPRQLVTSTAWVLTDFSTEPCPQ